MGIRAVIVALFLGLIAVGLVQCTPGRCTQTTPLVSTDGGAAICVRATDCPQPSNVLVCANTQDRETDCVDCINTQCVRFSAIPCP